MKMKVIEIEATASELKSCNAVADGILNVLRGAFNSLGPDVEDESEGEEDE